MQWIYGRCWSRNSLEMQSQRCEVALIVSSWTLLGRTGASRGAKSTPQSPPGSSLACQSQSFSSRWNQSLIHIITLASAIAWLTSSPCPQSLRPAPTAVKLVSQNGSIFKKIVPVRLPAHTSRLKAVKANKWYQSDIRRHDLADNRVNELCDSCCVCRSTSSTSLLKLRSRDLGAATL